MKFLGVDYGGKRIGLAVSNGEGTIAFPRAVLPNGTGALRALKQLCEDEHIERLVVGDARAVSGAENPITAEAERFTVELGRATGLPVARAFEAWSSVEASRFAPAGKSHDDSAAAAVILQRYLDMKGNGVR